MTQVVVWAENSVTRAGLAAMAAATTTTVAQVNSFSHLRNWLQTQPADLILWAMPQLTAAIATDVLQLLDEAPFAADLSMLLLLETWDEPMAGKSTAQLSFQTQLAPLMRTGWVSVLPLTVSAAQIAGAIAAIVSGLVVIHPDIAEAVSAPTHEFAWGSPEGTAHFDPLTPREIEVLNQLAAGLSNKAIAQLLMISEHTVKFHISAILAKLGAASRTEAVTLGIRAGLVMI